jgi:hypothetical protein
MNNQPTHPVTTYAVDTEEVVLENVSYEEAMHGYYKHQQAATLSSTYGNTPARLTGRTGGPADPFATLKASRYWQDGPTTSYFRREDDSLRIVVEFGDGLYEVDYTLTTSQLVNVLCGSEVPHVNDCKAFTTLFQHVDPDAYSDSAKAMLVSHCLYFVEPTNCIRYE